MIAKLRLAEATYPERHPLAGRSGAVFGYAARRAQGVFLFDTGIGIGNAWVEENFRPRIVSIDDALREHGVGVDEVVGIANSHLHFDHCGQNRRFPGVPIYVQRAEYLAARAEGYTVAEWVDFPGARYVVIDGELEPLPGVRVVATPGHTPGHQSVLVEASDGIVALAGHSEGIEERLRVLGAARILPAHELYA